jgi:hypothetical protein
MRKKFLHYLSERGRRWYEKTTAPAQSLAVQAETRAGKLIVGAVKGGLVLGSLLPFLFLLGLIVMSPLAAHAQTPGGNVFGASDQTVGNGIRAFCRWFRVFIFFAGVIGLGAIGIMKFLKIPVTPVVWGTVFCFGFAGIAQLVYSFSNGQDVQFNPDLG